MKRYKKHLLCPVVGLMLLAGASSCSDDKDYGESGDEVQLINAIDIASTNYDLTDGSICLVYGQTLKLEYTITPDNATNPNIAWSSNNTDVVSVSQDGQITAGNTTGSAIITVTPEIGFGTTPSVVTKVVKVIEKATLIETLSMRTDNEEDGESSATVYAGETRTMQLTALPETHTYSNYSWKSSNESVATVDSKGVVSTLVPGSATITATALDGSNATASYSFTVLESVAPTAIEFINTEALKALPYGASVDLRNYVKLTPDNATFSLIKWEVSDGTVGSVDDRGILKMNFSITPSELKLTGHTITLTASTESGTALGQTTVTTEGGYFIHNFKDGLSPFQITLREGASYNVVNDHLHVQLGYQSATDSRQDMMVANTGSAGGFMLSPAKYKYLAMKFRRPYYYDAETGTYSRYAPGQSGNKLAFNITPTNTSNIGHWEGFKQLDVDNLTLIDEIWDGQAKIYVWQLDSHTTLVEGTDAETGLIDIKNADIVVADVKAVQEQSYDIYWMGTFDSLEAIKEYYLANE